LPEGPREDQGKGIKDENGKDVFVAGKGAVLVIRVRSGENAVFVAVMGKSRVRDRVSWACS
jgi:hypothetical protein